MDKKIIKRLEELVEEIAECYTTIPEDILAELNDLTKNDWPEEEYIVYCAEYWSRSSLEETVYALLHNGEYPDIVENSLHFIRPLNKPIKPTLDLRHKLAVSMPDDSIYEKFETLPKAEIEKWFTEYFVGWEKEIEIKEDEESLDSYDYGETSIYFNYNGETEYEYKKFIGVSMSNDKIGFVWSKNLTPEEWSDVVSFFKNSGGYTLLEE